MLCKRVGKNRPPSDCETPYTYLWKQRRILAQNCSV